MAKFTKAELFARLDAEGRGDRARKLYDETYEREMAKRASYRGAKAVICDRIAMNVVMKKFPPAPYLAWRKKMAKENERERQTLKNENAKLRAQDEHKKRVRAERQASEELKHFHVVTALKDKTDQPVGDLPDPISWALNHMHEIKDPDDPTTWDIHPENAPTAGHWNLLMYACTSSREFMAKVVTELVAVKQREEKRKEVFELAEIKAALIGGRSEDDQPAPDPERRDSAMARLEALFQQTVQSGVDLTAGAEHDRRSASES